MAAMTFTVLAVYGYALLFEIPYLGFVVEQPDNVIIVLHTGENPTDTIEPKDHLLQVDDSSWEQFSETNLSFPTATRFERDSYNLAIERGGEIVVVRWVVPGINLREFVYRILSVWWLPYAFWLAGVVVSLLVRPKDMRWQLLYIFFYLIALGVSAGVVSTYRVVGSMQVMRSAIWLILPVSWHLHWMFPKPLASPPKPVIWLLYGVGVLLMLAEWLSLLPNLAYLAGFLLVVINCVALMVTHIISQPEQRRTSIILLIAVSLIVAPTFVAAASNMVLNRFPVWINISVLLMPGIAVVYIYLIYANLVEGMALRANRLITVIIYSGILLAVSVFLTFIATAIVKDPNYHLSIGIAMTFLIGLMTVYTYPVFQNWVERRILGIPLPPTQLLERYTARVTTSLGPDELIRLLRNEALPSLLIRQAALIRLDAMMVPTPLFTIAVKEDELPTAEQIPALLSQSGNFPRIQSGNGTGDACPWVLLVLPLSVGGQIIGVCLLGRRDPDDHYARAEINTLQALMDQTALALVNIEQAERLRAMYQKDIERQEIERSHLARELHDDVLNQLGILWMSVDERQADERFAEAYQTSVTRIREIISGLRPSMLMYGLRFALEELTEETATQVGGDISIQLDVPSSDSRYPPDVELHIFRIVQQACQNALKHSKAQCIYIRGVLDPKYVDLFVDDDGVGFVAGENLDLARLLANKHFGLAGMHERAALIGAQMKIDSSPGKGTHVRVIWSAIADQRVRTDLNY